MNNTGHFVTVEQCKELLDTGSCDCLCAERVDKAADDFYSRLDKIAVELGLPAPDKDDAGDVIHYGLDFHTREIVSV